ncbi:MAG: hypothetical protein JSR99_16785 [Proteobacteria bacterium]|nr:hypothetical protein [Pseudomonadota bacterium]
MAGKIAFAASAFAAALLFAGTSGMAASGTSLGALKDATSLRGTSVTTVGWNSRCHWGIGGYHKWIPGVGRVQCTARRCWRNSWGVRRCRWY